MNTKEIAYQIIDRLNESELKGFIMMFHDRYPVTDIQAPSSSKEERDRAWVNFKKMCISKPEFDEKAAKDDYFREKYGI